MHDAHALSLGQQQARMRWGTHESGEPFDQKKAPYLSEQAEESLNAERKTRGYHQAAPADPQQLWLEAGAYLHLFHQECGRFEVYPQRLRQVQAAIERTGTYTQTDEELAYGAKVAWRNNTRCIGRLHWKSLSIRDLRHLHTPEDIFAALVEHLWVATNGGKIRSTISIFAPAGPGQLGIRIWNPQLLRYAGYRQPDGSVIGDPLHADLTDAVRRLGWKGRAGTPFDLLPLVIQMPNEPPKLFELRFEVAFSRQSSGPLHQVETPEQAAQRKVQQQFATLVLKALPAYNGITLMELQNRLHHWQVSPKQTRPSVVLEALRHLQHAGLVASTANQPGDDLARQRYWRAPTLEK